MKRIIVGSLNPVKIEAVRLGFSSIWPNETWEVIGKETNSGINNQPMSAEETVIGARNRAQSVLDEDQTASFGVGLEGGLEHIATQWFDSSWCVVMDRQGNEGIGSGGRIIVPESMMKLIHEGKELGEVIDAVFNRQNARQAEGHFGLMTNGVATRTTSLSEGVILALSRFLHPELF